MLPEGAQKLDAKHIVEPGVTGLHERRLPFYRDGSLYRLRDPRWSHPALALYFVVHGDLAPFRLNGVSPPIHELNAKAPVQLTAENVLEYLRFFCYFVRGDEGPFYLLDEKPDANVPDEAWQHVSMDVDRPGLALDDVFRPAALHGTDPEGNYRCSGLVFYSNAIFLADFLVQPTGMIEMVSDEPLVADLPCRVEKPLK